MNLKRYMYEMIVAFTFLLMVAAFAYKSYQVKQQTQEASQVKHSLDELKEVIALKKIWGDKKLGKRVEQLHTIVPAGKLKWSKKQNKVTASYLNLAPNEFNRLMTKIANTPVVITLLDVSKKELNYNVEFKCKW